MPTKQPRKASELKKAAHPENPRSITDEQLGKLNKSLEAYGDLSGVIFNRRTRKQIGGHQRIKLVDEDAEVDCKYFTRDKQGTVGLGHVVTKQFGKIPYREVDWPKELEMAAMIAANTNAGDWEENQLRENLRLISESEGIDPETIMLEPDFLEKIFAEDTLDLNVQEQEAKALTEPLTYAEVKNLPSQTSMIQLFFTISTRPKIVENMKRLQVIWGTPNLSETVKKAIDFSLKHCKA